MKIKPKTKKWITVVAMVILAAQTITTPVNLKEFLPEFIRNFSIGTVGIFEMAAWVVLLCAYWVMTRQID